MDSGRTLGKDVKLLSVTSHDTDNILAFAVEEALFERAVQGFWVCDPWSLGPGVLVLNESHGIENVGVASWAEDPSR